MSRRLGVASGPAHPDGYGGGRDDDGGDGERGGHAVHEGGSHGLEQGVGCASDAVRDGDAGGGGVTDGVDGLGGEGVRRRQGVPVGRAVDRSHDGDAEGGADFAGGVVGRGGDALLLRGQGGDDRAGAGGAGEPDADSGDDQPQEESPVGGAGVEAGHEGHAGGEGDQAAGHDGAEAHPAHEAGRQLGGRQHHHCDRDERDRTVQRAVAQDELQELEPDEEEAEHRHELHDDRQGAGGEPAQGEQARIEQRLVLSEPADDVGRQGSDGDGGAREGDRVRPPPLGAFDDGEDQGADADGAEGRPPRSKRPG